MKHLIFLTDEGYTFQPNSDSFDPDVENLQVIGFGYGKNEKEAFENFISTSDYLKETGFDNVWAFELKSDISLSSFSLKECFSKENSSK